MDAINQSIGFRHIGTEHGLPQGTIKTIFQDSNGFIWIGTYDGLSRYDGYHFVNFKSDTQDTASLSSNIITSIIEDRAGNLWIGTKQNGVSRLTPATGKFKRFLSKADDLDSLSNPQVQVIHQDTTGRIWIGTNHGLNLYLPKKQAFAHFQHNPLDSQSLLKGAIVDIVGDGQGNLWVATTEGLTHFNVEQQIFTPFSHKNSPKQINDLFLDIDNSLWVGTRFDGLYHLHSKTSKFVRYKHSGPNSPGLSSNDIRSILRMRNGDLWVGTEEGGLNIRRKGARNFIHLERNSADGQSLTLNDIWSLFQDESGLIWVGTAGGGVNVTMSFENRISRLSHSPHSKNGLSHGFVLDIEEDKQGNIWLATLNGLDKYNPTTKKFKHFNQLKTKNNINFSNRIFSFTIDEEEEIWLGNQQGQLAVLSPETGLVTLIQRYNFPKGHISYHRVRTIEKDRFGTIWVGTDDGLLSVDRKTKQIIRDYKYVNQVKLGNTSIRAILQDDEGIFWFGTGSNGLHRYDPEFDALLSFDYSPGNPDSISDNSVHSLHKDEQGNLWIGTFNGLNLLAADEIRAGSYQFKHFSEKDGLINSAIYGISADPSGKLWLGTNKGLSEFDPQKLTFKNYTTEDGLTSNEFNGNSVARTLSGEIYFGSVDGVSIINPPNQKQTRFQPKIQVTNITIQGRPLLAKSSSYQGKIIELKHDNNDIIFEFSSLDFRHPNRNRFQYRLLPYNNEWMESQSINQATFTNLDPGKYTFELKATNSDGIWIEHPIEVKFKIRPPTWQTWWAYFLYLAILVSLIAYYLGKHEKKLQEQKSINEHLRRVDQLKDEFLANTSHELRTPLNGIIGIAESLKEGVAGQQSQKTLSHLQLIIDGGKRLSQLVNDILDFKKLSHQNLVLHRKAVDLDPIVNVVISLLKPLAEEKSLQLNNELSKKLPPLYADENRLQQVLHNLIGNAIKYTMSGRIDISAVLRENFIEVCVCDTGIGIDSSQLEIIFEPFEQGKLKHIISNRGTGLGLSVSRQLIEEHGGKLWVESKLNHGSKFFFDIPVWLENTHESSHPLSITDNTQKQRVQIHKKTIRKPKKQTSKNTSKGWVLIADDDPINLQVLSDLLQINGYEFECASDGLEAVELANKKTFDIAVIDIMMPGLSGYDVCIKLREKFSSIELPILLLSARNQPEDIRAGFEAGANDYVTKPIEREVLLSRIHTMRLLGGLVEAKQQQAHNAALKQTCERMGRYFPKQMVNQIIQNDEYGPQVAERKQLTVLFADLSGFTTISDRFEPEAITHILNSFLGKMGKLIESENGILNEILGDGLVVLFGAIDDMSKQQQARNAVALALKMQTAMIDLSRQWLDAGFDHNVKLRIGIHQDFVTVGNFGSDEIIAFRAVGSGINLASRLENFSEPGETTVSYPVFSQSREIFKFTKLQEIQFKGFNYPHRVCKLVRKKTIDETNVSNLVE